ncbi:MAG: 30S ribosomal protein S17 [Candidatus Omnitrophota bacterium]
MRGVGKMGKRKSFTGEVISDKMQKTIIVRITQMSKHHKYGRIIKKYNKFKVHDEKNSAKMGDTVKIEETRPLSKDKRYRLIEVTRKAEIPRVNIKEQTE